MYTETTKVVIERSKFPAGYTNIPNNHPIVARELESWKFIASALGVDFDKTGHTLTVCNNDKGLNIYCPHVAANANSQPVLVWGKEIVLLADTGADISIVGEKRSYIEIYKKTESGDIQLELSMMFDKKWKDQTVEVADVRKAWRSGELGSKYLSVTFNKPEKLSTLADGQYSVNDYSIYMYSGSRKVNLHIEGFGWYAANKTLTNRILGIHGELPINSDVKPINANEPATLDLAKTNREVNGHPVMNAKLFTTHDLDLEVFDFDFGSDKLGDVADVYSFY